ncbi:MAG: hypothetical protein IT426_01320 [Pirellulales bacterium]|nr:hypothetical protein [Pirellulales bacterium]
MKWKFQFSISSLFWLTLCLALLLTSILMYRRMADAEHRMVQAEAEAALMRKAAGYLVVGHKGVIHGAEVLTSEELFWKWRLYLPPERRFVLKVFSGETPKEGLPAGKSYSHPLLLSGEMWLSVTIRQLKEKETVWLMTVSYQNQKLDPVTFTYTTGTGSDCTFTVPISAAVMDELTSETKITRCGFHFGQSGTEIEQYGDPVILLEERMALNVGKGEWTDSPMPMPGIMIWLEEQKKP